MTTLLRLPRGRVQNPHRSSKDRFGQAQRGRVLSGKLRESLRRRYCRSLGELLVRKSIFDTERACRARRGSQCCKRRDRDPQCDRRGSLLVRQNYQGARCFSLASEDFAREERESPCLKVHCRKQSEDGGYRDRYYKSSVYQLSLNKTSSMRYTHLSELSVPQYCPALQIMPSRECLL